MIEDNLTLAWIYYLLGAAGLMLVGWRITRWISRPFLRHQCLVMMLVLLVCPFSVGEGYPQMAPALLMLAMETVFEGGEAFFRVGPTLIGTTLTVMLVFGLVEWSVRRGRKKQAGQEQLHEDHDELVTASRARNN